MQKHSNDAEKLRQQIIGLGENSVRKSYYSKLQYHIDELQRFRSILDRSQEMIFVLDAHNFEIIDINQKAINLLQIQEVQYSQIHFEEIFPYEIFHYIQELQNKSRSLHDDKPDTIETQIILHQKTYTAEFLFQKITLQDGVYLLITAKDISEKKEAEQKIYQLDFYDKLTQLPNTKFILQSILQALRKSKDDKTFNAVLLVDLDNFKLLNDTYGDKKGNTLLKTLSTKLWGICDHFKILARTGGDEFLFVYQTNTTDFEEASSLVNEFAFHIKSIINQPFEDIHCSCSMGIEMFIDEHNPYDVFKNSEIAMYEAKKSGKNSIYFFDTDMQKTLTRKLQLEKQMSIAIDEKQFVLYLQPIVNSSQKPIGYEALIRWMHPKLGLISPAEFIPLAEENGFIIELGEWVVKQACFILEQWMLQGLHDKCFLSVNISVRQIEENAFIRRIEKILDSKNINTQQLVFELTESVFAQNPEIIVSKMQKLNKRGIRFSLDDFGTGYSSLHLLKKLPIFELKIDQGFIKDIQKDPDDRVIIKTILAMAHNLSLEVVAEGVETQAQFDFLQEYSCDYYQGYLFGRPAPNL